MVIAGDREEGYGKLGVGDEKEQTTMYKIYVTKIYNIGNMANIYINYKWNITLKLYHQILYLKLI